MFRKQLLWNVVQQVINFWRFCRGSFLFLRLTGWFRSYTLDSIENEKCHGTTSVPYHWQYRSAGDIDYGWPTPTSSSASMVRNACRYVTLFIFKAIQSIRPNSKFNQFLSNEETKSCHDKILITCWTTWNVLIDKLKFNQLCFISKKFHWFLKLF